MSSTGVREKSSAQARSIKGLIQNEALFIQSLRVFANTSTLSALGATEGESSNSPNDPSGNYLAKSGDLRLGQFGNNFSILTIDSGVIDVSKSNSNATPVIILNSETPLPDDLDTIIQGVDVLLYQELLIRIANQDITFTENDNIVTPAGGNLVVPADSIVKLIYDVVLLAWMIVYVSSGSGGNIPNGIAENDHLQWDNTGAQWIAQQKLNFDNNTIALAFRNLSDTGDIEIKVDPVLNYLDITNNINENIGLNLRTQHAIDPDNNFTLFQGSGIGGSSVIAAPDNLILEADSVVSVSIFSNIINIFNDMNFNSTASINEVARVSYSNTNGAGNPLNNTIYSDPINNIFYLQAITSDKIRMLQGDNISTDIVASFDKGLIDLSHQLGNEVDVQALLVKNISQFNENMKLRTNGSIPQPNFSPSTNIPNANDGGDLGTSSAPWNNLNVKQIRLRDGEFIIDIASIAYDSLSSGTVYNVPQNESHLFTEFDGISSTNTLMDVNSSLIDVFNKRIVNGADPINAQDFVTKAYGDANYGGGGAQTPILQDVDYDGFDIKDISNVEMRNTTLAPSTTINSIWADAGGMNIRTLSSDVFTLWFGNAENIFFGEDEIKFGSGRSHSLQATATAFQIISENLTDSVEIWNGTSAINSTMEIENFRTTWRTQTSDTQAYALQLVQNNNTPANFRTLSNIDIIAENSVSVDTIYARISASSQDITNGAEMGLLQLGVVSDGLLISGMDIEGDAANANGARIGFFGESPVVQQQLDASPTNAEISTALRNLGLTKL